MSNEKEYILTEPFQRGYKKGRADAEKELKEKYLDADAYNEGLADGRADAIDEFLNELKNYALWEEHETILEIVAEQIKEKAE